MTYRYDNLAERMHEMSAMMFLTSAVIARVRLLGIVQKDRETAPAWMWRKVRSAPRLMPGPMWFLLRIGETPEHFTARCNKERRQRKAKYRLERRT